MKIGVYKNLNLGKKEISLVTKEEVDAEIKNLLDSKVKYEVKDQASALGDTVNIDFEGFLDGVPFDGGKDTGYDLVLGSGSFIPGFEDQLVGYTKGMDVDVNVTFPAEYHAENLAGKAVVFKCHINEVKARVMAELNDELAQEFGISDAKTLVEMLETNMNTKRRNDAINEYVDKAIVDILSRSEIEVSEDMVKAKIDQMVEMYEAQMAQYGMNMESYLGMSGKTHEEFRNDLTDDAINSAKEEKLMDAIASVEKFMINDDELKAEMMMYKTYYQLDDETFKKFQEEKKQEVYTSMMRGKVATFLYENNK